MKILKSARVHTYTFSEVYAIHNQGLHLQRNSCLITFDDGYSDNFYYAFPLLKRFKLKATIFINTAYIGNDPDYLTWEQIKQMHKSGLVDFELHSHRHMPVFIDDEVVRHATEADLADKNLQYLYHNNLRIGDPVFKSRSAYSEKGIVLTDAFFSSRDLSAIRYETDEETEKRIVEDISLNKSLIESNLGIEPHFFCWPWGHQSAFGKNVIKKMGIIGFVTTRKGTNPRKFDLEHIYRIEHRVYTPFKFWVTLKACQNLFIGRIYQLIS
ncbi:MAG: polysaccharide deacetylase family protein [Bacteroidota bacterium]|nr:polysaccharide deacetylase family protein [Bacteroidota bacterium]